MNKGIEHKFHVKHLCFNFKKNFPNEKLKAFIWEALRVTIMVEFEATMEKLKKVNEDA